MKIIKVKTRNRLNLDYGVDELNLASLASKVYIFVFNLIRSFRPLVYTNKVCDIVFCLRKCSTLRQVLIVFNAKQISGL